MTMGPMPGKESIDACMSILEKQQQEQQEEEQSESESESEGSTTSANKVGEVVSVHVIARPHDELEALIGALGSGGAE